MKQLLSVLLLLSSMHSFSQQEIPLYDNEIPGSKPSPNLESSTINEGGILIIDKVSRPTLTAYFPPQGKANGTAVIICPGGGYGVLAASHEGSDVAKRFNEMGITAFVLKYRIPNDEWMVNKETGPLQDAQRAIQLVRENAGKWNVNKKRIGIMGFSAGGHLASTAGTHFKKPYIKVKKKTNLRPDFMILVYPVITFVDSVAHTGSRDNLLGKNASAEKLKEYSNELQVTPETPPTFLVHAKDDPVSYRNTILFADALNKNNVYSEVFLYEAGGHGFGMINKSSEIRWMDRVEKWIKTLD